MGPPPRFKRAEGCGSCNYQIPVANLMLHPPRWDDNDGLAGPWFFLEPFFFFFGCLDGFGTMQTRFFSLSFLFLSLYEGGEKQKTEKVERKREKDLWIVYTQEEYSNSLTQVIPSLGPSDPSQEKWWSGQDLAGAVSSSWLTCSKRFTGTPDGDPIVSLPLIHSIQPWLIWFLFYFYFQCFDFLPSCHCT